MSIFVKLDTTALMDLKLTKAGPEGFTMWVRGLLYAKEQLTDGLVPEEALPFLSAGLTNPRAAVERLIELGLWVRQDNSFGVSPDKWARYQTTCAEVGATREYWREQKRIKRAAQKDTDYPQTVPSSMSETCPGQNHPFSENVLSSEHRAQSYFSCRGRRRTQGLAKGRTETSRGIRTVLVGVPTAKGRPRQTQSL